MKENGGELRARKSKSRFSSAISLRASTKLSVTIARTKIEASETRWLDPVVCRSEVSEMDSVETTTAASLQCRPCHRNVDDNAEGARSRHCTHCPRILLSSIVG